MCHLLKERYLIHNDDIKIFKDIKLLDENNKLIGVYPASEARKKAYNMKRDITLVNSQSDPVICKVVNFRNDLLSKFFDEIVYKHNEKCKFIN
jgi:translation initiation factor IF-3